MKNERIRLIENQAHLYEKEKKRLAGEKIEPDIQMLIDFLGRLNKVDAANKIPMIDLIRIALPTKKQIISGGIWTDDMSMPYINLNNQCFYIRENVGNVSCLGINLTGFDSSGKIDFVDVKSNIVFYSPDSEKMYIMTDNPSHNPDYKKYERYSIRELPRSDLYVRDANDGMQWLGADAAPEGDHFKEPVVITEFGYNFKLKEYSEEKCFVDKASNEVIYVDKFGDEKAIKLEEQQINGIIKGMRTVEDKKKNPVNEIGEMAQQASDKTSDLNLTIGRLKDKEQTKETQIFEE